MKEKRGEECFSFITWRFLLQVRAASLAGIPSFFDQSRAFADALKVNSTALSIDFAGIAIRDEDATLFAEALKSSQGKMKNKKKNRNKEKQEDARREVNKSSAKKYPFSFLILLHLILLANFRFFVLLHLP